MKNILIVDDERITLFRLKKFLEKEPDFHVLTGVNGNQAVAILEENVVDFVATDINMPEMDGIELLAHIERHYPDIPVVVMSAFGTPEIEAKIAAMGSLRFLNKPVDYRELTAFIRREMEKTKSVDYLNNITAASIMQLIEIENKTCVLEVENRSKGKGIFIFDHGVLLDAICEGLTGQAAAIEMISWDKVTISFKAPLQKKPAQRIRSEIMPLIIEGNRIKEERAQKTT
jgi:CheY-like chemotaxis protein